MSVPVRYVVIAVWCLVVFLVFPVFSPVRAQVCTTGTCEATAPNGTTTCAGNGSCTIDVYPGYCTVSCSTNCATNLGCGSCNGGNLNYTLVQSWTCKPAPFNCNFVDPAYCTTVGSPTCVLNINCANTCHPTTCAGQDGIIGCMSAENPTGHAKYDDCADPPGSLVCGWCPGTEPSGTPTTTLPPPPVTYTPIPTSPPPSDAPNCSNVSGPSTLIYPNPGIYTANLYSPGSLLAGEISYYNGTIHSILYQNFSPPNAVISTSWTPPATGTYSVCCRAWNDSLGECRPAVFGGIGGLVSVCAGPTTCKTVTVVPPPSIDGECDTTHYNCRAGISTSPMEYPSEYQWVCLGINGGANSGLCSEPKGIPIDGECDTTHYNCRAGISTSPMEYPSEYQWVCLGINGGANSGLCSEPRETQTPTPTVTPTITPTPTPIPGTIRAKSARITTMSCDPAAMSALDSTIDFNPSLGAKSANGGSYATWLNVPPDITYSIISPNISGFTAQLACLSTDNGVSWSTGQPSYLLSPGGTLIWNLGYTVVGPWVQTGGGGDVYVYNTLQSKIPMHAPSYPFCDDGAGGTPGVVTYGSSYNIGDGSLSSSGWLVKEQYASTNFYDLFYHRFGSPTTENLPNTISNKLASNATPYYKNGPVTIDTNNWNILSGESVVVFVNGNLTIRKKINIAAGGFAAFIVNGNIIIDPVVGGPAASDSSVIDGIYITSPAGTFQTGNSSNAGTERFVGHGIFIAGGFSLNRDLESVGANHLTSAELFLYYPQLLLTMPDKMKEVPITWQEVAP
jgi:hypothetical protein